MVKISHRLAIYYLNPGSWFYENRFVKSLLTKFNASLTMPHTTHFIAMSDPETATIDTIKPLESGFDFVIVFIPTRSYVFSIQAHAGTTIIFTSFPPANTRYSRGWYHTPISIIKSFLLEKRVFSFEDNTYKATKGDGKALMIACASVFRDADTLHDLYSKVRKFRLPPERKQALLSIINNKRKKAKIGGRKYVPKVQRQRLSYAN